MLNQETILNALKGVKYPGYSRDIVSFGLVKKAAANEGAVSVAIEMTSANREAAAQIKQACEQTLRGLPEVNLVHVDVKMPPAAAAGAAAATPNPAATRPRIVCIWIASWARRGVKPAR